MPVRPVQSFKPENAPSTRMIWRHALSDWPGVEKAPGCRRRNLSPEEFRIVSRTKRASGVSAVLRQHWTGLWDLDPQNGLCWMALERVQSPGNLGTLVRTARAVRCSGFLLIGPSIDPFSPAVVRASMGAFFSQAFVRTEVSEVRGWLDHHGLQAIGASPDGHSEIHRAATPPRPLLVLGGERKGLSLAQEALCSESLRIPMEPGTDSLNLGVAGSLMLYEVYRRQNHDACR